MSTNDIFLVLIILHVAGTVLGVGGATFIEVFLNKALADGKMDAVEKGFMATTYKVLRTGLAISVLTGLGFLVLYYVSGRYGQLTNPVLWAKNTIILTLVINAVLLHYHKMKLRWGSALSFVSWWAALILGIFLTNNNRYGYFEIMGVYIFTVVVGAFVLEWIRNLTKIKAPPLAPQVQTPSPVVPPPQNPT